MPTLIAPPPELRAWIEGGVIVHCPPTLRLSHFPALVGSMCVLRLSGHCRTLAGEALPPTALIGPSSGPASFLNEGEVHAVGLLLRPGTAALLLDLPGPAIVDRVLDWAMPWDAAARRPWQGRRWQDWQAQVLAARDDAERVRCLFRALRERIEAAQLLARLAPFTQLSQALGTDLDSARAATGLSLRQLERRSLAAFGLGPKQFHRIARLRAALHTAMSQPMPAATLALDRGYFDQSHLARDLRHLAGRPLAQLLREAGNPAGEHWALGVGRQLS